MNIVVPKLIALTIIVFCSCGRQKNENIKNDYNLTELTDSVKLEQYFEWTDKIECIKAYNYDLSALSATEKNRDTVMLLNFLTLNYDSIRVYDYFDFQPEDLVKYVYAIDINGDDLLDIIYDGPTGGEPNITQFFLNKGNYYHKIFSGYQDIIKVEFSENRIISFTLINPGCCADPQFVEYYYSVGYADSQLVFKLDKTIGYLSQTEKPQKIFTIAKDFTVRKEKAKLRSECYILDNVEHPIYGENGNLIANYKLGSKGKVLGIKKDNEKEWIYTEMNSTNKIDSCNFSTFTEQPTEIRGWLLKTDTDYK